MPELPTLTELRKGEPPPPQSPILPALSLCVL